MLEQDYSFLRKPLQQWVHDKFMTFKNLHDHHDAQWSMVFSDPSLGKSPWRALYEELGITEEEFIKQFILPWRNLNDAQLKKILYYWNYHHRFRYGQELVLKPVREISALQWTISWVHLLNLNRLTIFQHPASYFETNDTVDDTDYISQLFQSGAYCLPHHQCVICGRLDKDARGMLFSKQKRRFCHHEDCLSSSPNLPDHHKTCCSRQWNRKKDTLKQTLKNHFRNKELVTEKFLAYCEQFYKEGQEIKYPPRPKKEKPEAWKSSWSDLEAKHIKRRQAQRSK